MVFKRLLFKILLKQIDQFLVLHLYKRNYDYYQSNQSKSYSKKSWRPGETTIK